MFFILQPWRETFQPNLRAIILGYTTGCVAGILGAAEIITVFWYQYLHDLNNQIKTLFWACVSGGILSAGAALAIEKINFNLPWTDWLLILGHSITFVFHMPLFMYASVYVPGLVSIIGCTSTVYVTLAQYSFLSDIHGGNRNWMEIIGVLLILCSSLITSVVKQRKQNNYLHK